MKAKRVSYTYRCKQCGKTALVEDVLPEAQLHQLPPYDRLSCYGGFVVGALMTRAHNCLGQAYGVAELIGLRVIWDDRTTEDL